MKHDKANASSATTNIIKARDDLAEAEVLLQALSGGLNVTPLIAQLKQAGEVISEALDASYVIENTVYQRDARSNIYDSKSD